MPDPVTVWEVDLVRGRMTEREGVLILESDALIFRPAAVGLGERRLALRSVRRVKRLLASPVLLVSHGDGAGALDTAFYFVEPPPLRPSEDAAAKRFSSGKRKTRRDAVQRLAGSNRVLRGHIREWEREMRAAIARLAEGQAGG